MVVGINLALSHAVLPHDNVDDFPGCGLTEAL